MASIFTFQDEPHRVHSPWSTPGNSTPQRVPGIDGTKGRLTKQEGISITKLDPEKHDGPTEYKLHLLLRPRRNYTFLSTIGSVSMIQALKIESNGSSPRSLSEISLQRLTAQPSSHNRQSRLQQLTTQLLWRLQQSSPFHSSSNAKLVLPVLPEATPRLGVPDRPSKLLPGLEESQGALYEIGVADDGTLLGLTEEELEESLTNLRAMASSLGCVVDVLRRVLVGRCEWMDTEDGQTLSQLKSTDLWVAEVLVRPDNKHVEIASSVTPDHCSTLDSSDKVVHDLGVNSNAPTQQLRVAIVGASTAGKSSLLGALTNSTLDNGRGKSRLSLLKHRHEIASGITSSVAQELIGYNHDPGNKEFVVNYASGDVSSWSDIHNLANRLVFVSDSPGLARYVKSTFRSLISWDPAWVISCIAADQDEHVSSVVEQNFQSAQDVALVHLELCLKLRLKVIVVITKMDLATKSGLRNALSKILSTLKAAGKIPVVLSAASNANSTREDFDMAKYLGMSNTTEQREIDSVNSRLRAGETVVPIIMTSAVSGVGISKLHALLSTVPDMIHAPKHRISGVESLSSAATSRFEVDEVFAIPPSRVYSTDTKLEAVNEGIVLCGLVTNGSISLGDDLVLGPFIAEHEADEEDGRNPLRRTSSHSARHQSYGLSHSLPDHFSRSLQLDSGRLSGPFPDTEVVYLPVRIVSLRSLRLPVRSMRRGETGTVGVQTIGANSIISLLPRARKGMILTTTPVEGLTGYRTFSASFPATDFGGSLSPPLVLGGHAIAYIRTIRAAVKVMAVAIDDDDDDDDDDDSDNDDDPSSPTGTRSTTIPTSAITHDMFSFDDDEDLASTDTRPAAEATNADQTRDIRITFKFVSTIEYLDLGNQVLIVPTMVTAGPVAGPLSNTTAAASGLSGFVGHVCELHTS